MYACVCMYTTQHLCKGQRISAAGNLSSVSCETQDITLDSKYCYSVVS